MAFIKCQYTNDYLLTKEQLKETVAYQAMSRIGILYKIEEMLHDKTPEEK